VVAVANGVFGYGIADMARRLGAAVEVVGLDHDEAADPARVEEAIQRVRPKRVAMVHCKIPYGIFDPVAGIAALVARYEAPFFYVDAVSSAVGVPLRVDERHILLCLVGTQKCLSMLPDLGIVTVNEQACRAVREVERRLRRPGHLPHCAGGPPVPLHAVLARAGGPERGGLRLAVGLRVE